MNILHKRLMLDTRLLDAVNSLVLRYFTLTSVYEKKKKIYNDIAFEIRDLGMH
jgi:hypothetical protein